MAVPTYSEMESLVLDELQCNVSTDVPITVGVANELGRAINDAYSMVWELAGGRVKRVASATAWTAAQLATGTLTGVLSDVNEILHLFATTTAPAAISTTTNATTLLTSTAAFGSVTAGMAISGTGISADTFVAAVTDTSNLTMTRAATDSTVNSRTFSPTNGTIELDKVELSKIHWLRANTSGTTGVGTYAAPKMYAAYHVASALSTAVPSNLVVVEYWPSITSYYFPMHYKPQFLPMDSSITTPDLNDIQARDVVYLTALYFADRVGRAEFAPRIAAKLSEGTRLAMERRDSSLLHATQDT